jgi:hypothetical protein
VVHSLQSASPCSISSILTFLLPLSIALTKTFWKVTKQNLPYYIHMLIHGLMNTLHSPYMLYLGEFTVQSWKPVVNIVFEQHN